MTGEHVFAAIIGAPVVLAMLWFGQWPMVIAMGAFAAGVAWIMLAAWAANKVDERRFRRERKGVVK